MNLPSLLNRKNNAEAKALPPVSQLDAEQLEQLYRVVAERKKANCLTCGNPLKWDGKFEQYYCSTCKRYPEQAERKVEELDLTAIAFKTPLLEKKTTVDEEHIANCCRALTTERPRFFEFWSDGARTHVVAVSKASDIPHISQLFHSAFKAVASEVSHRDEKNPGLNVRGLLPPWLKPKLHYKVLNCYMQMPFMPFETLKLDSDPLTQLLTTLQGFSRFKGKGSPVYTWISVGWIKYDWSAYAREYAEIMQPPVYEELKTPRREEPSAISIPEVLLTPEKEAATKIAEEIHAPQLFASMRIAVFSHTPEAIWEAVDNLQGALNAFKGRKGGYFTAKPAPFEYDYGRYIGDLEALQLMAKRIIGPSPGTFLRRYVDALRRGIRSDLTSQEFPVPYLILTSDDLAHLVHLPVRAGDKGLTSIEWTRLEAVFPMLPPENIAEEGVPVGWLAESALKQKPYTLTIDDLLLHIYVLGGSGTGKSNFLTYLVLGLGKQMAQGKFAGSIWLLDPDGRLADDIVQCADDEMFKHILYFNPLITPWGMNLLALPAYRNAMERELFVMAKIDTFKRIVRETVKGISGHSSWGPRLEFIIQKILEALYHSRDPSDPSKMNDAPTLREVQQLVSLVGREEELEDALKTYGLPVDLAAEINDVFKDFPSDAKSSVQTKIGWFTQPFIRPFTCNRAGNLDFGALSRPGHIVLFSFSGLQIHDTAKTALMCNIIMNLYTADIQNKGQLPPNQLWPTIFIIDEFGRAAEVAAFEEIVSWARKYQLSLVLTHQGTEQLSDELRQGIMTNVRMEVFFRLGGRAAEDVSKDMDLPLHDEVAKELASIPDYTAIIRIRARGEHEQRPPFKVRVYAPPEKLRPKEWAQAIMAERMVEYQPKLYEETPAASIAASEKACMSYWEPYRDAIPKPSLYQVLFAVRDCFLIGLEQAKATEKPGAEAYMWPSIDRLWYFITQNRDRYTYLWGLSRSRMIDALEQLKSRGGLQEVSSGGAAIGVGLPDSKHLKSLVLFEVSAGASPTAGGEAHRRIAYHFLEYCVRQKSQLPKYVEQAGADPDGILVTQKTNMDKWDFDRQTAVEVEMDAAEHWDRVKNNITRDFKMGFSNVTVVCNTKDDARAVRERVKEDEDIPIDRKSRIDVIYWLPPIDQATAV